MAALCITPDQAAYVASCAGHGWSVRRSTQAGAALAMRLHVTVSHSGAEPVVAQESADQREVCSKCGHPVMRSWGGYGHAPGYRGKRHVVIVAS